MSIDTTKAMNYSWMSQASYLDMSTLGEGQLGNFLAALTGSKNN